MCSEQPFWNPVIETLPIEKIKLMKSKMELEQSRET